MNNSITLKETTKNHFNKTAKNYNNSYDGKFVKCMYDEIIKRVISKKPKTLLDLGCGNGNILKILSENTETTLYGLDLSEEMINEAGKRLNKEITLTVGDSENLPYENNTFDCIICNASFHHYTNPDLVLSEIQRVLKKNGTFILGDPTAPFKWYLKFLNYFLKYSNSGDYHIYNQSEITSLLLKHNFHVENFKKLNCRSFVLNAVKFNSTQQ